MVNNALCFSCGKLPMLYACSTVEFGLFEKVSFILFVAVRQHSESYNYAASSTKK